jgi:D-inositol-3-phosphate glycosyltransferase
MKIAIVAQHASPLDPRAGASPRPDDAGPGELTRILVRQGAQGDRAPAEAQPDVPDRAGLRVRIPVGAADTRGDTELLAHRPAFSDPLRARWRRELPDVVHAISWTSGLAAGHRPAPAVLTGAVTKTARLLASKGPQSMYARNS